MALAGGRVAGVQTDQGVVAAEVVVVAAGAEASTLCLPLGFSMPVDQSPALLLRFRTPRALVNGVVSTPDIEVRQESNVVLLATADYAEASGENDPTSVARRTHASIKGRLRGSDEIALDGVAVGVRPIPADRSPIVGFAPGVEGLYVAVMHSGVTMAPLIGRLATVEILEGAKVDLLQPCRPDRFAKAPFQ